MIITAIITAISRTIDNQFFCSTQCCSESHSLTSLSSLWLFWVICGSERGRSQALMDVQSTSACVDSASWFLSGRELTHHDNCQKNQRRDCYQHMAPLGKICPSAGWRYIKRWTIGGSQSWVVFGREADSDLGHIRRVCWHCEPGMHFCIKVEHYRS